MDVEEPLSWRKHWMFFAVASGACAAFNGVFAKLYVIPFVIQAVVSSDDCLHVHVYVHFRFAMNIY